ncbi:MAG: sensor histidine kinase [Thermoleophilaceae bacterium]
MAETTQCLVCVYDRDGRIVRFNRACEEMTGFAREEVLGRDARGVVIPPEESEEFGPFLAEVWATGRPSPKTGHWLTRDGGRRLISWANEPLLREDGEVEYLVTTGLDITERERKAAELRRLVDEQAALRRVATLVAGDAEPERIFQEVTEEVCRLIGIPSAVMERFDDPETATIVGRFSERQIDGFEVGSVVHLEEGLSALHVLRTGAPARVEDYADVPGEFVRGARAAGFRATLAVPIKVGGTTWGALIAALMEGESLPPETERRLNAFAELVALALASADAREALAASRARIVEASDAARRRFERNLHDGAQQRLVSLALTLRLARTRLTDDPGSVASLLRDADEELEEALAELRELAHGLHPALLVERGLGPALEAVAARAPFPVHVAEVPAERLPEPVEATAYYVASEALANAAKHADASSATVSIAWTDELALVEISDDGRGGATVAGGSGLRGLMDRVEALGGRLTVDSPPGGGTVVRAELPRAKRGVGEAGQP